MKLLRIVVAFAVAVACGSQSLAQEAPQPSLKL